MYNNKRVLLLTSFILLLLLMILQCTMFKNRITHTYNLICSTLYNFIGYYVKICSESFLIILTNYTWQVNSPIYFMSKIFSVKSVPSRIWPSSTFNTLCTNIGSTILILYKWNSFNFLIWPLIWFKNIFYFISCCSTK